MESMNLCISDIETIKKYIDSARFHMAVIDAELDDRQAEIDKLNDIIDELRDEKANMQAGFYEMIERGGLDISPCIDCGEMVVCIPDGMPMCEACAAKGGEA